VKTWPVCAAAGSAAGSIGHRPKTVVTDDAATVP
jgi:hypothetical protein